MEETRKKIENDNEKKIAIIYGKKMGNEVNGEALGEQYKGYIFKITGGNDKDGFTMKQGILVNGRVRLLLAKGQKNYRPRRAGERKRKSVRGCIVGPDIAVLALSIAKKGEKDIDGLTTVQRPNRLHVKRANKIRKLYNLTKEDDVKFYISKIGREIEKKKEGAEKKKNRVKRPKIQRLITDVRIRRKKIEKVESNKRRERTHKLKEEYHKLVTKLNAKHEEPKHEETKAHETKGKTPATKAPATKTAEKAPAKTAETKKAVAPTGKTPAPATTTKAPVKAPEAPKKDENKPATKTTKK